MKIRAYKTPQATLQRTPRFYSSRCSLKILQVQPRKPPSKNLDNTLIKAYETSHRVLPSLPSLSLLTAS